MTEALAAEIPTAEVSRIEVDRGGPSYSVETVEEILAEARRAGAPAPALYLVVGADLVPGLETWERAAELKTLVNLAVVSRPTEPTPEVPAGWVVAWVDGPAVDVSSSEVRARLGRREAVDDLVPAGVMHCIGRRTLYAVD
jgi:nicotinate-nucleotide adenylyltransferase